MTEALQAMSQVVDQKAASIKRLLKQLFGQKSEKKEVVFDDPESDQDDETDSNPENKPDEPDPKNKKEPEKKPKGHGRNGVSAYPGAKKIQAFKRRLKKNEKAGTVQS